MVTMMNWMFELAAETRVDPNALNAEVLGCELVERDVE